MIIDAVEEAVDRKDEEPVRRVAVRIPESLDLELYAHARNGKKTKSSIVTEALYAYFQKDGGA